MSTLPPGPRGRILPTLRFLARPLEYLTRWRARYGDAFTLHLFNGKAVLLASPEAVRTVFATSPDVLDPFITGGLAELLGSRSVLLLRGAEHRRERKLLMPPFHGDRMRAYAGIVADTATRCVAAADPHRARFQKLAQEISLEVIVRAVFGVQEDERARLFADAVVALIESLTPALVFVPFLQHELGGIGPFARFSRNKRGMDELLQDQIERTRARPGADILSLMLAARYDDGSGMSDEAIRDELRTLLAAGHETTAISLTWAVDLIHRHPRVLERVRAEIAELGPDPDPARFAQLPYLDAVCKEVLRLYPVITEVLRVIKKPMRIGAHDLPEGALVAPCIYLMHRDPELYPEPEAFRPERFLERKFAPHEYLPFGGGHRRCIGAAFAMFEMNVVLGRLLAGWDIELLDPRPPVPRRRNVSVAPGGQVPVRLRPRAPAAL
jgi:cytochrome P450 family 110